MRIVIADDHPIILRSLTGIVLNGFPDAFIKTVANGKLLLDLLASESFDLVLSDLSMPGMDGIEMCGEIKKLDVRLLIITQFSEIWQLKRLVKLDVDGILLKDETEENILEAIKQVSDGQKFFSQKVYQQLSGISKSSTSTVKISKREKEIIELICAEKTTQEIADTLFLSNATIETHRKNILLKLGAKNMAGLVRRAFELGIVD